MRSMILILIFFIQVAPSAKLFLACRNKFEYMKYMKYMLMYLSEAHAHVFM
jgi:hypothetical protein